MKIKKGLSTKVKGLADLNIDSKQREKIIKISYVCFRELKGFPEELDKLIIQSKQKNLSGEEAYLSIKEGLFEYEGKLTAQIQMNENFYPTEMGI